MIRIFGVMNKAFRLINDNRALMRVQMAVNLTSNAPSVPL